MSKGRWSVTQGRLGVIAAHSRKHSKEDKTALIKYAQRTFKVSYSTAYRLVRLCYTRKMIRIDWRPKRKEKMLTIKFDVNGKEIGKIDVVNMKDCDSGSRCLYGYAGSIETPDGRLAGISGEVWHRRSDNAYELAYAILENESRKQHGKE